MALSFEYAASLTEVWHRICAFQRRAPEYEYFGGHVKIALPELVDPATIPIIESSMLLYGNFNGLRVPLAELVLEQGYIPHLLDQFGMARAGKEGEELVGSIFNIFRMLVLLNSRLIFEELFSEDMAASVAAIFECDPALSDCPPDYHSFIEDESKVRQLFPLEDPGLESLIQKTIRLQYFKDVILPRHLDDEVYSSLTLLARACLNDIVHMFDSRPQNYEQLAVLFTCEDATKRLEVLKFFKDFIAICRASNLRQVTFFRSPILLHFLSFLQSVLAKADADGPSSGLGSELLLSVVQMEGMQVQNWMRDQATLPGSQQMMAVLIERLHRDLRVGMRFHIVSILRLLLDPPNPVGPLAVQVTPSFESFCEYFYAHHCIRLIAPFSEADKILRARRLGEQEADLYFHLCELTSTFVLLHKYRIKYQLVRDHSLLGISMLLRSHMSHVRLASLRLVHTLVSVKDEFYSRLLVSNRVFDRVFEALASCAHRNNLQRAALLDLFTAIHGSPCRKLVDELATRYRTEMESYRELHDVFPRLIQLYDSDYAALENSQQQSGAATNLMSSSQQSATLETTASISPDSPNLLNDKWGISGMDDREEDYFSSSGDLEDDDTGMKSLSEEEAPLDLPQPPPSPTHKPITETGEEYGGALGGIAGIQAPAKKLSLFSANLKNSLKTGFGLWRPSSTSSLVLENGQSSTTDISSTSNGVGDAEDPALSPSKKVKHA